jgi:hypothetical protein
MRKKVVVSNQPGRTAGRSLMLSRETIRTLTSEELSQAGGGQIIVCPTTSSTTQWEPGG